MSYDCERDAVGPEEAGAKDATSRPAPRERIYKPRDDSPELAGFEQLVQMIRTHGRVGKYAPNFRYLALGDYTYSVANYPRTAKEVQRRPKKPSAS